MTTYHSFLLRIWCSRGEEGEQWVARVEDLQTQEWLRFQDPAALLSYLHEVACQPVDAPEHRERPPRTSGELSRNDEGR